MDDATADGASLYRRLGGHEAVAAVVDSFTRRIVADDQLAEFFAHTDLARLQRQQAGFLAGAFGGPTIYRGPILRQVHRGRGVRAHDFARVIEHLAAALALCAIPPALAAEVLAAVATLRTEIVEVDN